jgi:hypothetical protein
LPNIDQVAQRDWGLTIKSQALGGTIIDLSKNQPLFVRCLSIFLSSKSLKNVGIPPEKKNFSRKLATGPHTDTNKDNPSGRQRQKKPRRGVKVDTAAKEKNDVGMFTSITRPSTLWPFSQRMCPKSFALISPVREKSVTTLIVTLLTPGRLQSLNTRQSLCLPIFSLRKMWDGSTNTIS